MCVKPIYDAEGVISSGFLLGRLAMLIGGCLKVALMPTFEIDGIVVWLWCYCFAMSDDDLYGSWVALCDFCHKIRFFKLIIIVYVIWDCVTI